MNHRRPAEAGRLAVLLFMWSILNALRPLAALVEPEDSAIRSKAFRHPDLHIGNVYVPASNADRDLETELDIETVAAYLDIRSGRWGTLMTRRPLLPGDGRGNTLSWQQAGRAEPHNLAEYRQAAWSAFAGFLHQHRSQLGVDLGELAAPGTVTVHRGGDLVQIHVDRTISGVPVRGSFLTGSVRHGNLVLLGLTKWGDVSVSPSPTISAETAIGVTRGYLGELAEGAGWRKSSLAIVPMAKGADLDQVTPGDGYSYRLAWVLRPTFPDDPVASWEALVDAHSGELIAFEDQTRYAGTTREVEGGVLPISNDGVGDDGTEQPGYPMPFADVTVGGETSTTDTGGNLLACVDGPLETSLSGPYLTVIDTCGAISESNDGAVLDLGTGDGTDCAVPDGASDGNTHASRTAFYELNRTIEWARSHLPENTWLRQPLPATMNADSSCNASGGAGGLHFFTSGGDCSNTGELAGVLVHEWGHGMDASDATLGLANPAEGIADVYASLRLGTSCVGRNYTPGEQCAGYGDPCTACTGIRDVDWAKRSSGVPHDVSSPSPTGIDALCGAGGSAPCGGSDHCEGAVFAEAVWDLWNRDLPSAYGMSRDTARELATRLNFLGSGAVNNFFSCGGGTGDGCNADSGYLQFLVADDDDGSLEDGTPHMAAIFAAFDRHEIACPAPPLQDSGCVGTPVAAPTVTATPLDRGVELTWPAVNFASGYRIFRTEGVHECDFGKIWIGETTGTSFVDSGLKNGREHYYTVLPMGPGDTCFGPASSCVAVTPVAGANLVLGEDLQFEILTGGDDGDPFLDNCEQAKVTVELVNVGTGTSTDTRITAVSSPSHPGLDFLSPLPAVAGDLAACNRGTADFVFQAGGVAPGEIIEIEITYTNDELAAAGQAKTSTIGVSLALEADLANLASLTFTFEAGLEGWTVTEGTFARSDAQGGGDGTAFAVESSSLQNNRCDRIRSPLMTLTGTSTLSLWNNWDVEGETDGNWYDRANVGVLDAGGQRTLLTPDGGRLYNADSDGPESFSGCNEPEEGWAGTTSTWGASTFSNATFGDLDDGRQIQLEVTYSTDASLSKRGFSFDEVTVTDVEIETADAQSDVCVFLGAIFTDGFESGDASAWSASSP